MDIGNQQRVIIVETEQVEPAESDMAEIEARLEEIAVEEWELPVEIDPIPVR